MVSAGNLSFIGQIRLNAAVSQHSLSKDHNGKLCQALKTKTVLKIRLKLLSAVFPSISRCFSWRYPKPVIEHLLFWRHIARRRRIWLSGVSALLTTSLRYVYRSSIRLQQRVFTVMQWEPQKLTLEFNKASGCIDNIRTTKNAERKLEIHMTKLSFCFVNYLVLLHSTKTKIV